MYFSNSLHIVFSELCSFVKWPMSFSRSINVDWNCNFFYKGGKAFTKMYGTRPLPWQLPSSHILFFTSSFCCRVSKFLGRWLLFWGGLCPYGTWPLPLYTPLRRDLSGKCYMVDQKSGLLSHNAICVYV